VKRSLPLYVYPERTRHGRIAFYFRIGKGSRTRLPDDPNSSEFKIAYANALSESQAPKKATRVGVNSLHWLVRQYRRSSDYLSLSPATRRQRDNIFLHVLDSAGAAPYRSITRKHIVDGRERRTETPAQARNFLDAMRGLFRWAEACELVKTDPTAGIKNPKRRKSDGFPAWTNEDVAAFEARWPEGSRERVWLHVLLYTGLRRGDAVLIGRQHTRDGIATIKTEKNETEVNITIRPELARSLDTGPIGDLAWICGERGQPLTKESFGNMFRKACNAAGIAKSAHGLRKLAATRAAEAGLSVAELESVFGWSGGTMASHYTKTADRKRLARQAWEKMENTKSPHLDGAAPHLKKRN